jgi:hypothetical protein
MERQPLTDVHLQAPSRPSEKLILHTNNAQSCSRRWPHAVFIQVEVHFRLARRYSRSLHGRPCIVVIHSFWHMLRHFSFIFSPLAIAHIHDVAQLKIQCRLFWTPIWMSTDLGECINCSECNVYPCPYNPILCNSTPPPILPSFIYRAFDEHVRYRAPLHGYRSVHKDQKWDPLANGHPYLMPVRWGVRLGILWHYKQPQL